MATIEMKASKSNSTEIMPANVAMLRENLLNTMPSVCVERARLVTEAYKKYESDSPVLRRARALAHVLQNMTVYIQPGEIIVGNQASAPRAAPIFPEYSTTGLPPKSTSSATVPPINLPLTRRSSVSSWKIFSLLDRAYALRTAPARRCP